MECKYLVMSDIIEDKNHVRVLKKDFPRFLGKSFCVTVFYFFSCYAGGTSVGSLRFSLRSVAGNFQHLTDIQDVAAQPVQVFDRADRRAISLR